MRSFRLAFLLVIVWAAAAAVHAQSSAPEQTKVDADILYNEGNSLYRKGNYQGAIEKYNAALALAKDFKYYYQLGLSYKNSRQVDPAITALEESIKLKEDFSLGYYSLAGTYLATRTYEKAIDAFKQALKFDPKLSQAQKGMSEAYAGEIQQLITDGRLEKAGALVDEALEKASENAKLYLLAAITYNKLDQPEKALKAAEEALTHKKKGSKAAEYFEKGIALRKLNQYDLAREAFDEAKKDPTYSRNAQYELESLKGKK